MTAGRTRRTEQAAGGSGIMAARYLAIERNGWGVAHCRRESEELEGKIVKNFRN